MCAWMCAWMCVWMCVCARCVQRSELTLRPNSPRKRLPPLPFGTLSGEISKYAGCNPTKYQARTHTHTHKKKEAYNGIRDDGLQNQVRCTIRCAATRTHRVLLKVFAISVGPSNLWIVVLCFDRGALLLDGLPRICASKGGVCVRKVLCLAIILCHNGSEVVCELFQRLELACAGVLLAMTRAEAVSIIIVCVRLQGT